MAAEKNRGMWNPPSHSLRAEFGLDKKMKEGPSLHAGYPLRDWSLQIFIGLRPIVKKRGEGQTLILVAISSHVDLVTA